ncbi:MAG: glutamyl-tRNA synthetase [Gaiellaceae bacterium]|nr:glutamyl-tRNA synthetase [Gaiellaceae bacterium]
MSVRVRMAPSPTGFLHIGGVRTFLFNWLFARQQGGELFLRIENTDTSREVEEAVDQIKNSLIWLGIDWDGDVRFQLDTADTARALAQQLLSEGKAYEDDGAIRFRQPKEGTVSWNDAVRGEIEFKNELLPDLVIVRSDGRPTYNFISPVDDITDKITHVIRGEDHVSNTPSQINILRALGADLPTYAHVPNINGADGRKLSKRRNAVALDDFRNEGYLPAALFNFLALLGWSYDDKTTIMSRKELLERFSLERVVPSPATFDYKKLDWMNGMYLRDLQPDEYALDLIRWLGEQGIDWPEERVRATVPLVQEKLEKFSAYPEFVRFLFEPIEPPPGLDGELLRAAHDRLASVEPWDASVIDEALRTLADELGQKPRQAFAPIRLAVTGAKVSPGLFESLELLGKDESLKRLGVS